LISNTVPVFTITLSPRIRKSPYYDAVVRSGVSNISVYNKMMMPTSYGDLRAEYDRLINHCAIWDVAVERQVQIAGPDALAATQYFTARDITDMVVGQGKYVAMCDHAGNILNDPVLMKMSHDRYWFSIADNDMLLWCKGIAAEKAWNVDVTEPDVSPLAVQGPKATDLIAELFGDHIRSLKYFWFIETHLDDIPLVLCRSGWSKQGGFELFLQDGARGEELWDLIVDAGEKYGIGPGAPNHVERVESGLVSWGGDNTPDSNPFELGMGRFVDVDTDVEYIGKSALQAVVANGGPSRLFVGLNIEESFDDVWPLTERSPVWVGDTQVGTLSAVVYSHRLQRTIGLAQIDRRVVEDGAPVEVEGPHGRSKATTQALPFL